MKKIWKDNAKLILIVFITVVIASGATYAATTMYDSNIVGYDNTTSGLRSTNVQSALDEVYSAATDYTSVNTRLTDVENTIGSGSLTTTSQNLIGAVNGLNNQITAQDITSQFTINVTPVNDVIKSKVFKTGNTIVISIVGTITSSSSFLVSNIPTAYRPKSFVCVGIVLENGAAVPVYFYGSNDVIYADSLFMAGNTVRGTLVYTI